MTHHNSCEEMKHSGIVIDTLKHLHMGKHKDFQNKALQRRNRFKLTRADADKLEQSQPLTLRGPLHQEVLIPGLKLICHNLAF